MTAHFNLALFPQSAEFIKLVTALAQDNLCGQTDKYLLGEHSLPHVTLAQFVCPPEQSKSVWNALSDLANPVVLRFSHIYIRAGNGPLHQGKNWVGLHVVPSPELLHLQVEVFSRLNNAAIDSPTKPANYFPHLTLGRFDAASEITIGKMPSPQFWQTDNQFNLSMGLSDELGVYHERIY